MTDRDYDSFSQNPRRGLQAIVWFLMLVAFTLIGIFLLFGESEEETEQCDPTTDFTCEDPNRIIVRFIANYHFMSWQVSYLGFR